MTDREETRRRLVEYSLPRGFARMRSLGRPGSLIGNTLTLAADFGACITFILVQERLGFWPRPAIGGGLLPNPPRAFFGPACSSLSLLRSSLASPALVSANNTGFPLHAQGKLEK